MRGVNFRRTTGYDDAKVNELTRDVQQAFDAILDINLYKPSVVWKIPYNLQIPYIGGAPRLSSPEIVRCERATNLTNPTWSTAPGPVAWQWIGNNEVQLNEVGGLIVGQKYDLVFLVIG